MKAKCFLTFITAVNLLGCGVAPVLDQSARDPGDDESIVVMKAGPADFKMMFFPGVVTDGQFRQGALGNARINAVPKDGYIVVRTKAGETLGLTSVLKTNHGISFLGWPFEACNGAKAIVFEVPKARVVYLTDIDYEQSANGVTFRYGQDINGAAAYLRRNFPEIKRELEPVPFRILPTANACTGSTVLVPVYVGH